jgi:hypothetical protein
MALDFVRDLVALRDDETRRRTTTLTALIVQAEHIARVAAVDREADSPRPATPGETEAEYQRRVAREAAGCAGNVEKYEGTPDRQFFFDGRGLKMIDNAPALRGAAVGGGTTDETDRALGGYGDKDT